MTIELILAETESDPANLGYAGQGPREVHDLLSAPTRSILVEPATPDVANFLYNHGMFAALYAAKLSENYAQLPIQLRGAIEATLGLSASNTPTMNFNNAGTRAMTGGFVAAGLWSQAQVDLLIETLARRPASRAVELWGGEVSLEQVARALWNDEMSAAEDALIRATVRLNELKAGINNA